MEFYLYFEGFTNIFPSFWISVLFVRKPIWTESAAPRN